MAVYPPDEERTMKKKTSQAAKEIPWQYRCCRWLLRMACAILLGVATHRALELLPHPLVELQRLGLVDALAVPPAAAHSIVAGVAAALYAACPVLGGAVALASLLLPMAFLHVGLAGVYAALASLCLPCLARHEGVLVLALVLLAAAHPGFAWLLLLVPVLAGLLCGRWLGPYTAAVAALVLVVLGLVGGWAKVGLVHIGGDRNPLMAGEHVAFVTAYMPLMPPELYEDAGFVEDLREAVREGDGGTIVAWLFLMMQWWLPTCSIGAIFAFAELGSRLLAPHLVGLVVLWAVVAGAVSWGVWWVKKSAFAKQTSMT